MCFVRAMVQCSLIVSQDDDGQAALRRRGVRCTIASHHITLTPIPHECLSAMIDIEPWQTVRSTNQRRHEASMCLVAGPAQQPFEV